MLEIFQDIRPAAAPDPPHGKLYSYTKTVERYMLVCKRWKDIIGSRPSFWNVLFIGINYCGSIREAIRWL